MEKLKKFVERQNGKIFLGINLIFLVIGFFIFSLDYDFKPNGFEIIPAWNSFIGVTIQKTSFWIFVLIDTVIRYIIFYYGLSKGRKNSILCSLPFGVGLLYSIYLYGKTFKQKNLKLI